MRTRKPRKHTLEEHSISICFSTTDNFISRVVRWFTLSDMSHCYITFRDRTLKRVMIMESDWGGFKIIPWDSPTIKGKELLARYSINADVELQLQSIRELVEFLGTGYDYMTLLALAIRRIRKGFERPLTSPTKLICSESVVKFINGCGVSDLQKPHTWTPQDVYAFIVEHPELFTKQE